MRDKFPDLEAFGSCFKNASQSKGVPSYLYLVDVNAQNKAEVLESEVRAGNETTQRCRRLILVQISSDQTPWENMINRLWRICVEEAVFSYDGVKEMLIAAEIVNGQKWRQIPISFT